MAREGDIHTFIDRRQEKRIVVSRYTDIDIAPIFFLSGKDRQVVPPGSLMENSGRRRRSPIFFVMTISIFSTGCWRSSSCSGSQKLSSSSHPPVRRIPSTLFLYITLGWWRSSPSSALLLFFYFEAPQLGTLGAVVSNRPLIPPWGIVMSYSRCYIAQHTHLFTSHQ